MLREIFDTVREGFQERPVLSLLTLGIGAYFVGRDVEEDDERILEVRQQTQRYQDWLFDKNN